MNGSVKHWQAETGNFSCEKLIGWAFEKFGDKLTLASSFGAEDVALIHIVSELQLSIEVFFLDTGRLPQQTYDTIEKIRSRYSIELLSYFPSADSLSELSREIGPNGFYLSKENRRLCCSVRKTEPLRRALLGKEAWITGLRKEQSETRNRSAKLEWDDVNRLVKINPLVDWETEKLWDFIHSNKIPYNPLHDKFYPSIGCAPCTRAILPGEPLRAGRWWWEAESHKECGLHQRSPL